MTAIERSYIKVIIVWALVLVALYAFERLFS